MAKNEMPLGCIAIISKELRLTQRVPNLTPESQINDHGK